MKPQLYKKTKWLRFYIVAKKPKTVVIDVINTKGQLLGQIYWGRWRQYVHCSNGGIEYNDQCLDDIKTVVSELNTKQKEKRA